MSSSQGPPARPNAAGSPRHFSQIREANQQLVLATLKAQKLQADAERMQRQQLEFLALLAHEIRNPLAPLRTGLDILESGSDDVTLLAEVRAMMRRQLTQLVLLVDDLLDGARISGAGLRVAKERVSLGAVIENALETSSPHLRAAGHRFQADLCHDQIFVEADPLRLAQAFTNLLNNAAHYTPAGGGVEITASRDGNEAVVCIADTGIGIAANDLPHIFEMFTRGEQGRSERLRGLGIGLALVHRVVELHGGSVMAHSAGLGSGSTFVVRLPIAPSADPVR